jgi:hypothetical protein
MCVILLFSNKTDKKHENIKDTLFQNANIILYKQKSSKKHYQFFSYRFSSKKEIQMCYNGLSPFFPSESTLFTTNWNQSFFLPTAFLTN